MEIITTRTTENEQGVFIELSDLQCGTVRICTRDHGKSNDGFIESFGYRKSATGKNMCQTYCLDGLSHNNLLSLKDAIERMIAFNIEHNLTS